jgi:beta-glucuronidase
MKNRSTLSLKSSLLAMAIFACLGTSHLRADDHATTAGHDLDEVAMINVDHRNTTALHGTWEVIIDRYKRGFLSNDLGERRVGGEGQFSYAAVSDSPDDKMEYGFENGETLEVPGDWNTQDERLFFYEGAIWYKRDFTYDLEEGKRLFVYFGAANYEAITYLNAEELGRHRGGFTPFSYEITDKHKDGKNTLVVLVDNTRQINAIPTIMRDWWNYGGLTRRVLLVEEEATFIRDYKVQLAKDSMNRIAGWVQLDGDDAQQNVSISIPEAGAEFSVETDENGRASFEFEVDLELWSPENPKLYTVQLTSDTDTIEDRIGFRSIQVKGRDIYLNGKSIYIRGISIHEEAPIRTGRAFSESDARTLLGWAKEMNCNFVRLAHYPHNETMVRMADEMGLLVWSEIPLYWAIDWEDPTVKSNADNMLTQMIGRDKNRASVIIWSVANETRLSDERLTFLSNLTKLARAQDPTRLISAALLAEKGYVDGRDDNSEEPQQLIVVNDPLGAYLDVVGCNQYQGWYSDRTTLAPYEAQWETIYEKPFVFTEFGAGIKQGLRGDKWDVWTEEYGAMVYENQIKMIENIDFVRGTSPWLLMDFRSPRRMNPRIQDYFNRKGLISERGQKKDAFYVLQEFYERKKNEQ